MSDPDPALAGGRQALLDQLIQTATQAEPTVTGIVARPPDAGPLPLSYSQQRLWFYAELEADLRQYHIPVAWRLAGDLDGRALRAAFDALAARHEALRTSFPAPDGLPVQVVAPAGPAPLDVIDVSRAGADDLQGRSTAAINAPFDLHAGLCWRGLLARVGEREHRLLLVFHHIVFDGWSGGVMLRDLGALYRAELGLGRPPPPLAIQYPDYALWERERLESGRLETLLEYWRNQLRGAPQAIELRTDRPRPDGIDNSGAVADASSRPGLRAPMERLCAEERATPFMVVLAAFGTVLSRYAATDDVVLGTVVANRSRREVEDLIGFFVNTVLLRLRYDGARTFRDAVRHARDVTLGAFGHQELPLDALIEELRPPRDLSRNPLFQVLYSFIPEADGTGWDLPGVGVEPVDPEQDTSQFDLTLVVRARGDRYDASMVYATALFDAGTVERLLGHLHHILDAGLAEPDRRLDHVPLATAPEQALIASQQGERVPRAPATLHGAVEAQARRTPEAVALVHFDRSMTYEELDAAAGAVARHLAAAGAHVDEPIGLCLARSPEAVVGVLAILKAGGGYLPLEPDTPPARVEHMLRRAGARLCLTDRATLAGLPPGAATYLCVEELGPPPGDVVLPAGDPDAIAGVYFTSGSTGQPKGVACHHRGWYNTVVWEGERERLGPGEVRLLRTSLTFDISVVELFAPLVAGATLAVGGPEDHRDPGAMIASVRRHGVTVMSLVPSLFKLLLDEVESSGTTLGSLRYLWCGGEAFSSDLAERGHRLLGSRGCGLENQWGPTEASAASSAYHLRPGDPTLREIAAIGHPAPNNVVHVLDDALQPLPPGVAGEIFISGEGVARGYVSQPGLTAGRFLPDPLASEPGMRMYATGDVGWRRPDGALEFVGRVDDQVKVRGMRVELGEVEARLEKHPAVARAAVAVRGERLVAYVERTRAGAADPPGDEALLDHMRAFLPDYMVPSAFVALDEIPMGLSGKIDRKALPEPRRESPAATYEAPSGATEEALAELWATTLDLERVGVNDDFFDLGGHSLSAVRLIGAVRRRWGRDVPLRLVFAEPTVAGFARRLEGGEVSRHGGVVTLARGPATPPLVLAHPIGGTVFCYRDLAASFDGDRTVWGLEAPAEHGGDLRALAARHCATLVEAQPEGPYVLGGWSMGGVVAYEVARQLAAGGAHVAELFVIDALPPVVPEARADLRATERRVSELIARVAGLEPGEPAASCFDDEVAGLLARFGVAVDHLGDHEPEDLLALLRGWHANVAALAGYEPPPGDLGVRLLVASEHDEPTVREASATWDALAERGCTVDVVDGEHLSLLAPAGARQVAERIRSALAALPGAARPSLTVDSASVSRA